MNPEQLKALIRDVPDFPQPGIVFRDITPLLANPEAFSTVVDTIVVRFGRGNVDKVVGIEARGFIVAAPVAYHFSAGFVPVRKKGKLPFKAYEQSYDLEYGSNTIAIHVDAFQPGARVLLVDDLLATGGTAAAAAALVRKAGGKILEITFFIELSFLKGREKLKDDPVHSLVVF